MKKKTLLQSSGFVTLCASLVCIVIGLLVGFLVLLLLGGEKAYSDGFKQILLIGIDCDKLNALYAGRNHSVDNVIAGAADADDFNLNNLFC